jgi:hypothetical protein
MRTPEELRRNAHTCPRAAMILETADELERLTLLLAQERDRFHLLSLSTVAIEDYLRKIKHIKNHEEIDELLSVHHRLRDAAGKEGGT